MRDKGSSWSRSFPLFHRYDVSVRKFNFALYGDRITGNKTLSNRFVSDLFSYRFFVAGPSLEQTIVRSFWCPNVTRFRWKPSKLSFAKFSNVTLDRTIYRFSSCPEGRDAESGGISKESGEFTFHRESNFRDACWSKKKSRGTCNIREQRHARHSFLTDWRDLGENIDGFETIELVSRRFLLARRFSSLKKR